MRAVDKEQRTPTEHLETTGHAHGGESLLHDVGSERVSEERLHGRQRHRRVDALMGAVQGNQDILVAAARGPQRHDATTDSHPVRLTAEVTTRDPH